MHLANRRITAGILRPNFLKHTYTWKLYLTNSQNKFGILFLFSTFVEVILNL